MHVTVAQGYREVRAVLTLGDLRRVTAGCADDLPVVVRFHVGEGEAYEEDDLALGGVERAAVDPGCTERDALVLDCSSREEGEREQGEGGGGVVVTVENKTGEPMKYELKVYSKEIVSGGEDDEADE